ncbi:MULTISPECIES: lipopolysaccharide heptosyltransferase RfaC [Rahnella]|uniref:Lipopolysaccharide heptosyltransferase 1 n=1 Tax=Rahnella laticis TaxID=2787622 RepID=A0ABS0EB67_9GAMM|nr:MULTISPECIES: lipopolysaccharide heptosyltransferase RfaC [Rahnella]MBF7982328.1 lipopolysaccharide heptosyltransferase RfaC [Rahnella laticis]MBF8002418.1 lipopolysaccharide heptosyltransferase RfaC [Rahnella sp. LAC-M12]
MRVLIVKTSSMGDVLHTLPALTDAMQAIPGIRFDWVVEEGFTQIPGWHPAVDRVIPVAIRRWRKNWFGSETRQQRCDFKREVQSRTYDAVIDAQGLIKSAALITRVAKGEKHGQDCKSAREPFASWFYNQRHEIDKKQHAVERTRELFAKSLGYEKPAIQGDYAIAARFLSHPPEDAGQYLVFLHATTRADKHWPEEHWRELIGLFSTQNIRIKLPWGAEHEYQRALRLAEGFSFVEVLPKLSLQNVAEVLAGAKAVVSVDTGLSHLTAALDRPNITLYGPTDPGLIGGYGKNQFVLKADGNSLENLKAGQVFDRLDDILSAEKEMN